MKYIALDCHKQYDHAAMIYIEAGEIKTKRLARELGARDTLKATGIMIAAALIVGGLIL